MLPPIQTPLLLKVMWQCWIDLTEKINPKECIPIVCGCTKTLPVRLDYNVIPLPQSIEEKNAFLYTNKIRAEDKCPYWRGMNVLIVNKQEPRTSFISYDTKQGAKSGKMKAKQNFAIGYYFCLYKTK